MKHLQQKNIEIVLNKVEEDEETGVYLTSAKLNNISSVSKDRQLQPLLHFNNETALQMNISDSSCSSISKSTPISGLNGNRSAKRQHKSSKSACYDVDKRNAIHNVEEGNEKINGTSTKATIRTALATVEIEKRHIVHHSYHNHYHDPIYHEGGEQTKHVPPETDDEHCEDGSFIDIDLCGSPNRNKRKREVVTIKTDRPRARGGVTVSFPEKLYEMLWTVKRDGQESIVSWQPHGRCFLIHKKESFVKEIVPRFFNQTKWTSFQRQLNLYGFLRLTTGNDRGAYYHELFLLGRVDLCRCIIRTRIKGNSVKSPTSPSTEPNFYVMEYCTEDGASMQDNWTKYEELEGVQSTRRSRNRVEDEERIGYDVDSNEERYTVLSPSSPNRRRTEYHFKNDNQDHGLNLPLDIVTIPEDCYSSPKSHCTTYFPKKVSPTNECYDDTPYLFCPSRPRTLPNYPGKYLPGDMGKMSFQLPVVSHKDSHFLACITPDSSPTDVKKKMKHSNSLSPLSLLDQNVSFPPLFPSDYSQHNELVRAYEEAQPLLHSSNGGMNENSTLVEDYNNDQKEETPRLSPTNNTGSFASVDDVMTYVSNDYSRSNPDDYDCGIIMNDDLPSVGSMSSLIAPTTGDQVFFEGNMFYYLDHDDVLLSMPNYPFDRNFVNDLS